MIKIPSLINIAINLAGAVFAVLFLLLFPAAIYGSHIFLGTHWAITTLFLVNSFVAYFAISHAGTMINIQSSVGGLLSILYLIGMFILFLSAAFLGAQTLWFEFIA
jgi:hypothetical protein